LLPAIIPAPVLIQTPVDNPQHQAQCGSGTSDGEGNIAVNYEDLDSNVPFWDFFSLAGGQPQRVGSISPAENGLIFIEPIGQPSGFSLVNHDVGTLLDSGLRSFSHGGQLVNTEINALSVSFAADPNGGLAVLRVARSADDSSTFITSFEHLDQTGAHTMTPIVVHTGKNQGWRIGVSTTGNVLVTLTSTNQDGYAPYPARWFAHDGTPLTDWFTYGTFIDGSDVDMTGSLTPLLDGSLVEHPAGGSETDNRQLRRIFPNAQPKAIDLPAWLTARDHAQGPFLVRSGKAYAMTFSPQCSNAMEVLAPSGKSCGCVPLPGELDESAVGRDGTVLLPHSPSVQPDGSVRCSFDVYPQLLK
jgi:hypothetical protein